MESILTNSKNSKHKDGFRFRLKKFSSPILCLNDISLDAPLIAVVWQGLIAEVFSVSLEIHHHLILGTAVWLCYSADRCAEPCFVNGISSSRHQIFKKHKMPFVFIWIALFFGAFFWSFLVLPPSCLLWGIHLFGLCVTNFILCKKESKTGIPSSVPKEMRTAGILAFGCLFFPAYEASLNFVNCSVVFFIVFYLLFINCLSISRWELTLDSKRGSLTFLQQSPRLLQIFSSSQYIVLFLLVFLACTGLAGFIGVLLFVHSLALSLFVLCLDLVPFLTKNEKRMFIDQGYWVLPLLILATSHADLF
jgi:hypothetical protein